MRKTGMTAKFWASAEFQARQLAFNFGYVARAVIEAITPAVTKGRDWLRSMFPHAAPTIEPAEQMHLPLFSPKPATT